MFRLGLCDNEIVINPTRRELQSSQLDLIVTATKHNLVVMLEGKGNIVLQQDLLKAIKLGTREAQYIVQEIERLQKLFGKQKQILTPIDAEEVEVELRDAVCSMAEMRLREIFQDATHDKLSRDNAVNELRSFVVNKVWSSFSETDPSLIVDVFNKECKRIFRELIFETNKRCDGRDITHLRDIHCQVLWSFFYKYNITDEFRTSKCFNCLQVDLYKPLHGSCLFQRGQTQVLCTVALDSQESAMKLDNMAALER